jgi:hypothetical protein
MLLHLEAPWDLLSGEEEEIGVVPGRHDQKSAK